MHFDPRRNEFLRNIAPKDAPLLCSCRRTPGALSENTTMPAMCAEFGFHIAGDPDDPGVKTVPLS
jgi:hypothetical protein